jgi:hypothetical protein
MQPTPACGVNMPATDPTRGPTTPREVVAAFSNGRYVIDVHFVSNQQSRFS